MMDSWESWLCEFGIVPQDTGRPVTQQKSMVSGRPLGDGAVGHAMLLQMPVRSLNRNFASLHHSTAKGHCRYWHNDSNFGMEECQPKSHRISQLSGGIVGSPHTRSQSDWTLRCIWYGGYQASAGRRLRDEDDITKSPGATTHWYCGCSSWGSFLLDSR